MVPAKSGIGLEAKYESGFRRRKGREGLLLRIFEGLYTAFGPQYWWPAGDSHQGLPRGFTRPGDIGGGTARDGPLDSQAALEVMVGAILTQNTAWSNVEKALENLRSAGFLTLETLRGISEKQLARLLKPSGYFNIKAQRLMSFINFLYKEYNGDIPKMLSEEPRLLRQKLLSVKGIGPETADSMLLYAGGFPWFVVDAYTRRIFARHGLVADEVSYQGLQHFFMKNLPRDPKLFNEYHALLVRLGKEVCRPKPLCEECPLLEVLGEPVHIC